MPQKLALQLCCRFLETHVCVSSRGTFQNVCAALEIYVLSRHHGQLRICRELILDHATHITNISLSRHIPCSLFEDPCLNCLYARLTAFNFPNYIGLSFWDVVTDFSKEDCCLLGYTKSSASH